MQVDHKHHLSQYVFALCAAEITENVLCLIRAYVIFALMERIWNAEVVSEKMILHLPILAAELDQSLSAWREKGFSTE